MANHLIEAATEELAKRLFKERYPERYWHLISKPQRFSHIDTAQSASEAERQIFRALAEERLRTVQRSPPNLVNISRQK